MVSHGARKCLGTESALLKWNSGLRLISSASPPTTRTMDPKDVKSDTEVREHATAPSPKDEKHAGDHGGDLADYANAPAVVVTEADNKRLFWMINRRILPVMLVTYFCQSLDKGTLNFASIMGIRSDANLVGQQVWFFHQDERQPSTQPSIV